MQLPALGQLDALRRPLVAAAKTLFAAAALACALGEAHAAVPSARAPKNLPPNPVAARLLKQADAALAAGQAHQALIDLKLAAGMEPNNPTVIARLGVALVNQGDFANGEENLRHARSLGAPDEQVLAPLFFAMLTMGEEQTLLDLFADPGPANRSVVAGTILRARAAALFQLGDDAGAASAIKRSLAIARDFDALMTAARIAFQQQESAQANAFTDEALKLNPKNIDAQIFKINLVLQSADREQASLLVERLVAEQPRSMAARLERIKVYLDMGRIDKAKPDVDLILSQTPDMTIALYFRAIILARSNKLAAAWTIAHVLPSEFVQSNDAIAINVADMAAGAGFLDTAANILNKAVFKNPNLLEARLKLVEFRLLQNSPQYALNALALVEDSKDPRVAILFARTYMKLGRNEDAQKYLERAIELGGGEALADVGKDVALKSLHDWLQQHPDDLHVRSQYAILLMRFGDLSNAKNQYEQLLHAQPTDALSLNNLAWLVLADDPKRALALAQRAVHAAPGSPNYLDTLGSIQLAQSDRKGALASLQQAHQLSPDNPEFSYHLGMAYEANGDRASAIRALKDAAGRGNFADLDNARQLLAKWK